MQLGNSAGLFVVQAGAEQVGEQVVVAPPAAHLIQRRQEQAGLLHVLQHRLASGAAGNRVAQRGAEAFQHRGVQQKCADLLTLPLEHLLGQIIQHVTVAPGECRYEPGDITLAAQRQASQLQPGCPPLGPRCQRRHDRIR